MIGTLLVIFAICQQAKKVFLKNTHIPLTASVRLLVWGSQQNVPAFILVTLYFTTSQFYSDIWNMQIPSWPPPPLLPPHTALDTQELVNLNLTQLVVWRLLRASLVTCSGKWPCVSALRVKLLLLACLHCFDILCSSSEPCVNTSVAKCGICLSEYNLGL